MILLDKVTQYQNLKYDFLFKINEAEANQIPLDQIETIKKARNKKLKPMLVKIKVMESALFEESDASTPRSYNLSEQESDSDESADLIYQSKL